MSRKLLLLLALGVGWIPADPMSFAQVTTGTISGTAKDEQGGILPGVAITVKHVDTGMTRTAVTDQEGRYVVPNLPLGDYEVQAELGGFQTAIRSGLKLTVGREAVVDFTLKLGEMTEKIVVTGEAPLVDTTSSALYGLVDDKEIRDLPLNGRSFDQLALLQPGVVQARQGSKSITTGFGLAFSVSGARPNQSSYLLDGTDINNLLDQPGSMAGVLLGVEAVREFQILTSNFSAEYGRAAGGVVSSVTRSGTNEFHGSVFEFHRNDNLDARNFFDLQGVPEFKRNQFGFSSGGPIIRNKTFFFGTYEGLKERLGVTRITTVPNALARRGLLPDRTRPGQFIDVGVDPAVKPYLDLFPLPNGQDFGDGTGLFGFSQSQPTDESFFQVRIDHQWSDKDSIFGRYTFDNSSLETPFGFPKFRDHFETRNQFTTLQHNHIFSPTVLNAFRFSFSRTKEDSRPLSVGDLPANLAFLPDRPMGQITVRGLTDLGLNIQVPRRNLMNLFEPADQVTVTRGSHSMKFGTSIKRFQANVIQPFRLRGQYVFRSLQEFLQARTDFYQGMIPGTDAVRGFRQSLLAFYAQDDLRLRPYLTLNLGLRYEFHTDPTEHHGKAAYLNPITAPDVTVGKFFLKNDSFRNFAPRIGLAWDPFRDGKTSVRAGFGIFYESITPRFYYVTAAQVPPFFQQARLDGVAFPGGAFERFSAGRFSTDRVLNNNDPFFQTPHTLQWNLSIQRQVAGSTAVTVGYVGTRGINLSTLKDNNTAIPQVLPDGRKFIPAGTPRRNTNFSTMNIRQSEASSFYHSLQVGLRKRFGDTPIGPLHWQVSYAIAKSIDEQSSDIGGTFTNTTGSIQDTDNIRAERSLSAFDVRQNLTINYTYELPLGKTLGGFARMIASGWQLNGITTLASGNPFNVQLGLNQSRSGASGSRLADRPNLKPGSSNNPTVGFRTPDRWFDVNAFELQPPGFFGNLGRNTVIGPGFVNFDFSVVKNSTVQENVNLQFKAEFFNIFNRANFSTPQNSSQSGVVIINSPSGIPLGNAARIFSTVSRSRQIQFGLKLIW